MPEAIAGVGGEGRTAILEELYARHFGRAVAVATLLTGDRFLAEDLAQDCFIRAAARLGRTDRELRFEAYLQRAVVNACRSRFRRSAVERSYLARHRDVSAGGADHQEENADRDVMWAAIESLPYRQRAAIVLRYYEDLSEVQTGEVLRCSPRAVNALVSRALSTLRLQIQEEA